MAKLLVHANEHFLHGFVFYFFILSGFKDIFSNNAGLIITWKFFEDLRITFEHSNSTERNSTY